MVQAVGGTSGQYAYQPVQYSQPTAYAASATTNPYSQDGYSGGSYAMASAAASGTISAIVSDPKAAGRFSMFMINTPERLLKVGAGFGAVGRGFLNLLAGNVPLFTPSAQRAEISNNVRMWLSSADLVRTGPSPVQAMLLQDVGIWNARDLAVYVNPSDQAVLAGRMAGAAAARGVMEVPSAQQVGAWVAVANQVSHYNY